MNRPHGTELLAAGHATDLAHAASLRASSARMIAMCLAQAGTDPARPTETPRIVWRAPAMWNSNLDTGQFWIMALI